LCTYHMYYYVCMNLCGLYLISCTQVKFIMSLIVCMNILLCVFTYPSLSHYFVCACPSDCLLGCVRVIAWIYLVLCIRVCFYHIISCVYECVYRLLCVFCVRRIVLFVCAHNGIMAHSVWCECVRACTNYKCVCIN